jgi:hypothetical protein
LYGAEWLSDHPGGGSSARCVGKRPDDGVVKKPAARSRRKIHRVRSLDLNPGNANADDMIARIREGGE